MAQTEKVCFDRILPSELRRPIVGRMIELSIGPSRAAFQIAKLWPTGSTLRIGFLGGTASQQAMVKQFCVQWIGPANLKFQFTDVPNAQIRVAFNDDGAWSYIGNDALGIPANQPTMNFGWLDEGVILHEFGHMIGMIHEHQNPRTNPIEWNKSVVNAALSGPPNFWDQPTIDHNIYRKYEVNQINGSDFDTESVMLYTFPASWTVNGFQTDPNETLSAIDKEFAKNVYPGAGTGDGAQTVELPVYEGALQAEIGQAGEEDRYKFTAKTEGRYTIETEGQTDLVMSLYSSDGMLIAQDDDSGTGRNPKITIPLNAGDYKVQVRHYNASGGTGTYGIKVMKS